MNARKYTALFIVALAVTFFINLLITVTNVQNMDYLTIGNTAVSRSVFENVSRTVDGVRNNDYNGYIDTLKKEYDLLSEYRDALYIVENRKPPLRGEGMSIDKALEIIGDSQMSDSQAENRQNVIKLSLERLNYAVSYHDYVKGIMENSDEMSSVSIFDSHTKNNIIKARMRYYGLENISVSAEQDAGVNTLMSDRITDILGLTAAVLCSLFYVLGRKKAAESIVLTERRAFGFALMFLAGICSLYAADLVITDRLIGIGDMSRAVQSVWEYLSCTYAISVGTFITVRIVFKLAACLLVYFAGVILFSADKLRYFLAVGLFVLLEIILNIAHAPLHFTTLLGSDSVIGKFNSINILGEAVDTTYVMTFGAAAALAVMCIISFRCIGNMLETAKENSEKKYYDEITDKYNETRIIRHDMKNHLTAVAMLMDEGRNDEARKYLDEISAGLDGAKPPVKTGSSVLDALLLGKYTEMRAADIDISTEFTVSFSEDKISGYDLCGIFGNILDNAIEAAKKLDKGSRRITLTVKKQMDIICIFCENNYADINADLSTKKADKAAHGMGLKRVQKIAKKYGGDTEITFDNGVFSISVILNMTASP